MVRGLLLLVLLASLGCAESAAQPPFTKKRLVGPPLGPANIAAGAPGTFDPARLEVLHQTTRRFVDEGKHAGMITLLMRDGVVADFQAYGYRDVEQKLPMERDTICRVYSMSKIITSVATLILLEEGRFNLDDPVAKYLPELKDMKVMTGGTADAPKLEALKRPITIKHLMTHTSGLVYDFSAANPELAKMWTKADIWNGPGLPGFIQKLGKLPLKHQPGEAWTYGVNQDVQGALIEKVSGKPFGVFLQERIFGPLGMVDTSFDVPPEKMLRLAKTYKLDGGKFVEDEPIVETWPEPGRGIEAGGAGIFSTAIDYARFAQMLCNGGTLDGRKILGRKTVELLTADHLVSLPASATAGRDRGFGLGVEVVKDPGRLSVPSSVGQFGWYGAATTYCQIDPKERVVAIALAQHFPFNQHGFFAKFQTGYSQAMN